MSKKIPKSVMHEPAGMAWAETTPMSEHKEREKAGVKVEVIPIVGRRKIERLPLSRATTELRRAYPYIFDCAAYVKTHSPEMIRDDEFYSVLAMPYHVFWNYCLDGCEDQQQYLKNEIYKLMNEQHGKYIKVSEKRSVYAWPIVVALSHTDLEPGKDERITKLEHDAKVNMVQIMILKELLNPDHGYLNVPKAMYAKTRQIVTGMINWVDEITGIYQTKGIFTAIRENKKGKFINMTNQKVYDILEAYIKHRDILAEIEQGEYHPVYLALEYILIHKGRKTKNKEYSLLALCEKCYPKLVQLRDGKRYFNRDKNNANGFLLTLTVIGASLGESMGIDHIGAAMPRNGDIFFIVYFS